MPSADQPLKGFAPLLAAVAIVSMATGTLRLKLETWFKTRSDLKPPSSAMATTRPPEATSPSSVDDLPAPAVAAVPVVPRASEATSPFPVGDLPAPAVAGIVVMPTRPQGTSFTVGDVPPPAVAAIAKTSRPPEPAPLAAASIDTIAIAKRPHEPTLHATAATREAPDLSSPAAAAARARAVVERSVGIPNAKILEPVIAKRIGDGSSVNRAKRLRYQTEVVAEIPRGSGTPIQHRYILTLQYVGGGEWQVEGMQFATRY